MRRKLLETFAVHFNFEKQWHASTGMLEARLAVSKVLTVRVIRQGQYFRVVGVSVTQMAAHSYKLA